MNIAIPYLIIGGILTGVCASWASWVDDAKIISDKYVMQKFAGKFLLALGIPIVSLSFISYIPGYEEVRHG